MSKLYSFMKESRSTLEPKKRYSVTFLLHEINGLKKYRLRT